MVRQGGDRRKTTRARRTGVSKRRRQEGGDFGRRGKEDGGRKESETSVEMEGASHDEEGGLD
eukprot:347492-Rhodomonas_salina.1